VSGYVVYENGTQLATSTSTSYAVTGLTSGQQYSFTVAATDSSGNSAQSSSVSVNTGTQAQTYTVTITAVDANGVVQTGAAPTVQVAVTQ
jgi:cellulose 1,4-beta-cellobiosidase